MKGLYKMLLDEQRRLQQIISRSSGRLADAPEGRLRLSSSNKTTQYYHVLPGETGRYGTYISKENKALAEKLAQKEYDAKVLKLAESRLEAAFKGMV